MTTLTPLGRRLRKRASDQRAYLVSFAVVAGSLLLTAVVIGALAVCLHSRIYHDSASPEAVPAVFGPPPTVHTFSKDYYDEGAEITGTSYMAVKRRRRPHVGDWLQDVARQEDLKREGKTTHRPTDLRIDGVYYVHFKHRAGISGEWASYSKGWIFFMHPEGSVSASFNIDDGEDWRSVALMWLDNGQ